MKKKNTIIILSITAVLICALCVGGYAIKNYKSPIVEGGMYQTRKDAPKTKDFEVGELPKQNDTTNKDTQISEPYQKIIDSLNIAKNGTELTYKETVVYSETAKIDVYVDKNQNEYKYTPSGELITYNANAEAVDTVAGTVDKDNITIEYVKALAPKYAEAIFGDDFNGFSMDKAEHIQSSNVYLVTFTKKYGKDEFIKGEHCYVQILPNGALQMCNISRGVDYDSFDTKRLEGITEDTIKEFINEQVKAEKDVVDYEIYGIFLENVDGDFCLKASVTLIYNTETRFMTEYVYKLK